MKLQGLTRGFFLDLRAARIKAGATGVTVNRDFVAVTAFLRWSADVRQLAVPAINLPRQKANAGRERWLSADELAQLYVELPGEWGHREAVSAGPQDYVFPAPFSYQAAERIFARVVRRLAWPHTVVHDLRHTFGVHAVMAGVALPRLQKILGHKTPAMTLRYAQHAPEPHAQDDAAKLAASMAGVADRESKALLDLRKIVEA